MGPYEVLGVADRWSGVRATVLRPKLETGDLAPLGC